MKKIFGVILFASFLLSGCGKQDSKTSESKSTEQKQETKTQSENSSQGEVVEIKLPTIQCGMCKKSITKALKNSDGVKEVDVIVNNKIVKVIYDKSKTDLSKIEGVIVMTGYQANDKQANKEAYDKLEACCKIGGHDK